MEVDDEKWDSSRRVVVKVPWEWRQASQTFTHCHYAFKHSKDYLKDGLFCLGFQIWAAIIALR